MSAAPPPTTREDVPSGARPPRALALLVFALGAACAQRVDLDAERARLREADQRYTAAADAGDVETLVGLYAADATRYPPNGPPAGGPDAIRAFAEGVAGTPGFSLSATPLELEVSAGGDMGYTLNALELSTTGPDGAPVVQHLRDFHAWRKEPDGAWRIVVDVWHVQEEPGPEG